MRFLLLLFTTGLACAGFSSVPAAPIPTGPIHTANSRFRIPFRFDAAEMRRLGAREIRLFVSEDRGRTWKHAQSVAPNAGRFDHQAPHDGEFWFSVRTVDARGKLHPAQATMTAGLKVAVDTTEPLFNLAFEQDGPGRALLHWSVSDLNLDHSKLEIEYIRATDTRWQRVDVASQPTGQKTISIPQGGRVAVRGSAVDQASNVARAQAQVQIAPARDAAPSPNVPDFSQPVATDTLGRGMSLSGQFPSPAPAAGPTSPWNPFARTPSAPRSTASGRTPKTASHETPRFRDLPLAVVSPQPQPAQQSLISDTPAGRPKIARGRYVSRSNGLDPIAPTGRYRAVNAHKFHIAYKLDEVGPSGVSVVEMFITQDEGKRWWKYGTDTDRQSPFEIQVPADGVYGFSLRVRSGAGISEAPPQPGEPPEIRTLVDATPPKVELLPLQQGQGPTSNNVRIRWRASDDNLIDKPVALFYAVKIDGPWIPITGWTENVGAHIWSVGPAVPAQIFVRLSVRDIAGNVTQVETPQPVIVDLSRPSARIVDVEADNGRPQR